jgi:16S rRNA (cytidine1402-2'-O)-methyltransferase
MPGTLYVVATPIGNLEDVTLRALRVLREVSLIAAEDTRRTARLLQHYSISTPTTSLHQHNERQRGSELLGRLIAGESIALVSDAGTPVVSDPGTALVAAAHAAGVRVEPVPGPSAAIAALSASGLPADEFTFLGFPPAKGEARRRWFEALRREPRTLILYEAPHRLRKTLESLADVLGNRDILVAREITKLHEELVIEPISEALAGPMAPRGEYTIVVGPHPEQEVVPHLTYSTDLLKTDYHELLAGDMRPRQAVRALAEKYGLTSRDVYAAVHASMEPSSSDQ